MGFSNMAYFKIPLKLYESYIMPESQNTPDIIETIRLSKSLLNADIGDVDHESATKNTYISGQ